MATKMKLIEVGSLSYSLPRTVARKVRRMLKSLPVRSVNEYLAGRGFLPLTYTGRFVEVPNYKNFMPMPTRSSRWWQSSRGSAHTPAGVGEVLAAADYAIFEARVMAELAQEERERQDAIDTKAALARALDEAAALRLELKNALQPGVVITPTSVYIDLENASGVVADAMYSIRVGKQEFPGVRKDVVKTVRKMMMYGAGVVTVAEYLSEVVGTQARFEILLDETDVYWANLCRALDPTGKAIQNLIDSLLRDFPASRIREVKVCRSQEPNTVEFLVYPSSESVEIMGLCNRFLSNMADGKFWTTRLSYRYQFSLSFNPR